MSNLNRADDTNPSPLVKKKKDCWYDSVKNDEDIKILSEDGSRIKYINNIFIYYSFVSVVVDFYFS